MKYRSDIVWVTCTCPRCGHTQEAVEWILARNFIPKCDECATPMQVTTRETNNHA